MPLQVVTGGTIERDAFDAAMTPVGVFMGCKYTDPNLGYELYSQSYPAGTVASDIEAYVADATDCCLKLLLFLQVQLLVILAIT